MKRISLGLILCCLSLSPYAQEYPTKAITWLVGYEPGGTTDVAARIIAPAAARELGQQFVVQNRPGAVSAIAIEAVRRAPADGYTIILAPDAALYQPVLLPSLSFRADRDLTPIGLLINQSVVIAVHPSPGWRSVADVIKAAQAQPEGLTYALPSATGTQAVAGALFFRAAGVKMQPIPFKGGGQAVVSLIGGQVPIGVLGAAPLVQHARSGRVRMLAVTSKQRSASIPDVPTLAELGFPSIDITQWYGILARSGTTKEVVNRLSTMFNKVLKDPPVVKALTEAGLEVLGGTPEEMAMRMRTEIGLWAQIAKEAGMHKN